MACPFFIGAVLNADLIVRAQTWALDFCKNSGYSTTTGETRKELC
jgi:hypothetical protein